MGISKKIFRAQFPILVIILEIVFILVFWFKVDYATTAETSAFTTSISNDSATKMRSILSPKLMTNAKKYPIFQDVHVMIFVGFGFLMTFLRHYSFSAVSLNLVVSAVVIQWSLLLQAFIANHTGMKFVNITKLILADFDCAVVLISFGAVLGKISPMQLILMGLIETPLVKVNIWIVEEMFYAADIGGSMVLHAFGAYFGLACALVLKRKPIFDNSSNTSSYNSDIFSMIGTIFLWTFWPSFNSALAGADLAERAIINTYLSLTASTVITFALATLNAPRGKFKMVLVQNATLAGGVAVGSISNFMLHPSGALIIGSIAGAVSVFGFSFLQGKLEKVGLHDTCGVHNLHGMPGVVAGLASVVAAVLATEKAYGSGLYHLFPKMAPKNATMYETVTGQESISGYGRTAQNQALYQLAALGTSLGIAIGGGLVAGIILRLPIWDQVEEDDLYRDGRNFELPEDEEEGEKKASGNGYTISQF